MGYAELEYICTHIETLPHGEGLTLPGIVSMVLTYLLTYLLTYQWYITPMRGCGIEEMAAVQAGAPPRR